MNKTFETAQLSRAADDETSRALLLSDPGGAVKRAWIETPACITVHGHGRHKHRHTSRRPAK